jgi:predicted ATPase/class 3 adenylate cyclase
MTAPRGAVTFVFTDIVGSTRLWEKHPEAMKAAVRRHDGILRAIFEGGGGHVFKTVGDAFCVAFDDPADALRAAADVQRGLAEAPWGETGPLSVRIGVHTGTAEARDGDYFGGTLNRSARIESAAHGGQVLVSRATHELVLDQELGGLDFVDLGEHRLQSLERPEHLFQLAGDGLRTDFPPPRSLSVLPNNLPPRPTSFIGRAVEMAAVAAALAGPARLVTLTGSGGTGKTRLALEAGAAQLGGFAGGVWLVELAMIAEPNRIAAAITAALGVREEPGRPLAETLVGALCRRELLLIMDNCEHLAAPVAELVARLLRSCSRLKVLATSRSALGLPGEMTVPVPPLGIFDAHRDPVRGPGAARRMADWDAVRLFVERAQSVRPDFVLDDDNAAAVGEICARLDGIPLALELAAARLRVLDARQIAARLADRFRLVRGTGAGRLPHQQTLEALVDWSHELLTGDERALFRRLAVFAGGRSLESIEEVCGATAGGSDVLDLLQSLVEKSLVGVETGQSGEPRYTMLESVWHYAGRRLEESGESPALQDAHARHFLAWAVAAAPHFEGPEQAAWLARFDDEVFNLDRALRRLTALGESADALRLLAAMGRPMEVRGYLSEGRALAQAVLALPGAVDSALRARGELVAGRLAWALDDYAAAADHFTAAEALASGAGDRAMAASCRGFLGFLARGDGRPDEAEELFQSCLADARATGSEPAEALALGGLGRVAGERGRLDEARALLEAALAIHQRLGDQWIAGLVLWGLARTAIAQGDLERAEAVLRDWASIAAALGNGWTMPYILQTLAAAAVAGGRFERAARLLGAAEAQRERHGFRLSVAEQADLDGDLARVGAALPPARVEELMREGRDFNPDDLWILE